MTGAHGDAPDAAMRRYYAARAGEYERIYHKPERQADLRRLEATLPRLFEGRRVLEIACGTGYWTRFIAERASSIVAIDANDETLEIARAKRIDACPIEWAVGDAYALPDALGRFDAAFAGFWWSHVPVAAQRRFLDGLHARLSPGARVVLLDNLFVEGNSTPVSHVDQNGDSWQLRTLADGSEHAVLKNFPTREGLRATIGRYAVRTRYDALNYYWTFRWETKPESNRG